MEAANFCSWCLQIGECNSFSSFAYVPAELDAMDGVIRMGRSLDGIVSIHGLCVEVIVEVTVTLE